MFKILILTKMSMCITSIAVSVLLIALNVDGKDSKIVGGSNVSISEYPYQLFADLKIKYCGASIISEEWALTAGHCLENVSSPADIYLRAGSTNRSSGGTVHQASEFHIHPKYKNKIRPFGDYDYGVIKVNTPFPIGTPGVGTIKLASVEPKPGTSVTASGWGLTINQRIAKLLGKTLPETLKAATLTVQSKQICNFYYWIPGFTDRMVCAGSFFNNICKGDSGGPLVDKKTGEQVGIVSKVTILFQCFPGRPSVFSNIANQRGWIKQVTGV